MCSDHFVEGVSGIPGSKDFTQGHSRRVLCEDWAYLSVGKWTLLFSSLPRRQSWTFISPIHSGFSCARWVSLEPAGACATGSGRA